MDARLAQSQELLGHAGARGNRARRRLAGGALLVAIAALLAPSVAQAQPGVFVDPETPAGAEYAIPLEEARRQGTGGEGRGAGEGGGGRTAQPLFGVGIERAASASANRGETGGGASGSGPRDGRGTSRNGGDGALLGGQESRRSRGNSVAIEAAASGGSEPLTTAGIAVLVLGVGLLAGFGLRRLLRTE